jgi:23S rRNA (uracil1939-C5)-methyltransferase
MLEEETLGYRCVCSFQFNTNDHQMLEYAMRQQRKVIPLGNSAFPIATPRIQQAMKLVLVALNQLDTDSVLRDHLSSITFASSWRTGAMMKRQNNIINDATVSDDDCLVTLNYGQALPIDSAGEDMWKDQARDCLLQNCHLTTVTGRSKKRALVVGREPSRIEDAIYLQMGSSIGKGQVLVTLDKPVSQKKNDWSTVVQYVKPETSFVHPNANVMLQALQWLLGRMQMGGTSLLEMYCGCGAHTIPIAKTGLWGAIVAVEYDQRLVDFCKSNCRINNCLGDQEYDPNDDDHQNTDNIQDKNKSMKSTPVYVYKGDAAEWARKSIHARSCKTQSTNGMKQQQSHERNWYDLDFDALLVDPPRMGLDKMVCQMILEGSFDHVFYISCGQDALKRDLKLLTTKFSILDCCVLDLFPRTADAVESLVHLKRI